MFNNRRFYIDFKVLRLTWRKVWKPGKGKNDDYSEINKKLSMYSKTVQKGDGLGYDVTDWFCWFSTIQIGRAHV